MLITRAIPDKDRAAKAIASALRSHKLLQAPDVGDPMPA
jgi:hypothetical protein